MLSFQTAITHISSRIQTPDLKLIILIPVSHRDISSCPPAFSIHLYAVHKHNKYWKENRPILESIHKKHSNKWSLFISKPFIKSLSCWIWWVVLVKKKKTVMISSPPCWSQVRQSFVVQKTFQQPHSKTVLQKSPQITEVTGDKKTVKKRQKGSIQLIKHTPSLYEPHLANLFEMTLFTPAMCRWACPQ